MSRHLRSALSVVNSIPSTAGPSTLRQIGRSHRYQPHVQSPTQVRHASFNSIFPEWMTRRFEKKDVAEESETTESKDNAAGQVQTEKIATSEQKDLFDTVEHETKARAELGRAQYRNPPNWSDEYRRKSLVQPVSPRKLNLLARQIAGLPIDEAIVQMQFSHKKASKWIKRELIEGRNRAVESSKAMDRSKLVVAEAYVNKAKFGPKQIDIKARGLFGIKRKPFARLVFVLKPGQSKEEKERKKLNKYLSAKIHSAGVQREDGRLRRKMTSDWAW